MDDKSDLYPVPPAADLPKEPPPPARAAWLRGFAWRLVLAGTVVYLLLWTLPFPLSPLATVKVPEASPVAAFCQQAMQGWSDAADAATRWFGANVYPGKVVERVAATDSLDTKFDWLQSVLIAVFALGLGLLWALLDRRAALLRLGLSLLRLQLRYFVAWTMFFAGAMKVIAPAPGGMHGELLYSSFGSSAPMGLLEAFTDASPLYLLVAGCLEILVGLLLCFRRTTLLGALVGLAVLGHIVLLNLGYDLPAKRLSLHLLAMCVVLAAPDARRLWQVFVANRFAESAVLRARMPLWLKLPVMGFGFLFAAVLVFLAVAPRIDACLQHQGKWILWPQGSGLWEPVAAGPWRLLWCDGINGRLTLADGTVQAFQCMAGQDGKVEWDFSPHDPVHARSTLAFEVKDVPIDPKAEPAWLPAMRQGTFAAPAPTSLRQLTLRGELRGTAVDVVLRQRPLDTFLVWGRGFHWVQDRAVEGGR